MGMDGFPKERAIPRKYQEITSTKAATWQSLKNEIYFVMWWSLNVVFNIYNKKMFNIFPYP